MKKEDASLIVFLQRQSLLGPAPARRTSRSRSHRTKLLDSQRDRDYLHQTSRFGLNHSARQSPSLLTTHLTQQQSASRVIQSSGQTHQVEHSQRRPGWAPPRNWLSSPDNHSHGNMFPSRSSQSQLQSLRATPEKSRQAPSPSYHQPGRPNRHQPGSPDRHQRDTQEHRPANRPDLHSPAPISYPADSFQTAHIESVQCLQTVSKQLWLRIVDLDYKMDQFRKQVRGWITEELILAQQSILSLLEAAFRDQAALVEAYVLRKEEQLGREVVRTREVLEGEYRRVEELEGHLRGEHWHRAAGEILGSELEKKTQGLVEQAGRTKIEEWRPKSFVKDHLRLIQMQLEDTLKGGSFP